MENLQTKTIGWIGLGAMGVPMSMNLLNAGHHLKVYNRTKSKEEPLQKAGAGLSETPSRLLKDSDIIFIMVSDDSAVKQIFTNDDGLLKGAEAGKKIINMSTVSPEISKEMDALCRDKGMIYMDAPVSGSVKQATDATLVIMAGGEKGEFEELKPLFEILGKKVFHAGNVGAGNKTKIAINLFLAIVSQGLAESVVTAEKMDIQPALFLEVLGSGGLSSPYTQVKSKLIVNDTFEPAFALKHMVKDLNLVRDKNSDSELVNLVHDTFSNAVSQLGEEDVISIYKAIK